MLDQWLDSEFAAKWDASNLRGNPARSDQLDLLADEIVEHYQSDTFVLDLGIGSGILEEKLFERSSNIRIVGVDYSHAMVTLARERLKIHGNNCRYLFKKIEALQASDLEGARISQVIAVQSLHHLPNAIKRRLFAMVNTIVGDGGLFFILDRVSTRSDRLFSIYKTAWNRAEKGAEQKSGKTYEEYSQRMINKDEFPASVASQLGWLRAAGFEADCLDLRIDRALLVARAISRVVNA